MTTGYLTQIMDRPPQSTLILISSIVHLIATMVQNFQNWYGFVEENFDAITNPQLELFHEHLTHLLTFSGLLWILLLGIIGRNIRTLLVGNQSITCLSRYPSKRFPHEPVCVTLFTPDSRRGGRPYSLFIRLSALPY